MRILLVEPDGADPFRGNSVTVARWAEMIQARGDEVQRCLAKTLDAGWSGPRPDMIHAHHALKGGAAAARFAATHRLPLGVSLGGTDLPPDLDAPLPPRLLLVMRAAQALSGPLVEQEERLQAAGLKTPFQRVRRSLPLPPPSPRPTREGPLRLLMVGGLRPIKGQLLAPRLLEALRAGGLPCSMSIFGPERDAVYAGQVKAACQETPDLHYEGSRPHGALSAIYGQADLLVNLSRAEGCSNAIIEAWAHGLAVLATAVPGNRELLGPAPREVAHLLAPDASLDLESLRFVKHLVSLPGSARGALAREHIRRHHAPQQEAEELKAFHAAIGGTRAPG